MKCGAVRVRISSSDVDGAARDYTTWVLAADLISLLSTALVYEVRLVVPAPVLILYKKYKKISLRFFLQHQLFAR